VNILQCNALDSDSEVNDFDLFAVSDFTNVSKLPDLCLNNEAYLIINPMNNNRLNHII